MFWINKNKRYYLLFFVFLILMIICGCVNQESYLQYAPIEETVDTPEPQGTFFPLATPLTVSTEQVTGELFPTDDIGVAILDTATHFYKYYVSFSELRVYEEDERSYLDAICINGYDKRLEGKCSIIFYDQEGSQCGRGVLHTAENMYSVSLIPGENRVYAEISSEYDISLMPFEVLNDESFMPYE